uniref:Putative DNA binding, helix-turn-helix domain containing protein n=1 Tax=viral metagenome TaxID=1070528 RepID=A0A6M3LS25_9ZZZZ
MSQRDDILTHLRSGRSLTQLEALDLYGCLRLGARIYDLKREGYDIEAENIEVSNGKHVARYTLRAAQEALW